MTSTFKLNGCEAVKLLRQIIESVQKKTGLPMQTIVKNKTIKGMWYNTVTQTIDIDQSKAKH